MSTIQTSHSVFLRYKVQLSYNSDFFVYYLHVGVVHVCVSVCACVCVCLYECVCVGVVYVVCLRLGPIP